MAAVSKCAVQPPKAKFAPLPIITLREDGTAKRTDHRCAILDSENEERWTLTALHMMQVIARTATKNKSQAHQIMREVQECGLLIVMRMGRAADCFCQAARASGCPRQRRTAATMQHRLSQVPVLPWNWGGWDVEAAWHVQSTATRAADILRRKLGEACNDPTICSEVLKLNRVTCSAMFAEFKQADAARSAAKAAQGNSGQTNGIYACPRPCPEAAAEGGRKAESKSEGPSADGSTRVAGKGAKNGEEKEGGDKPQAKARDEPQGNNHEANNPRGQQQSSPARLSRMLKGMAVGAVMLPVQVVKKGIAALAPKKDSGEKVHKMLLPSQEEDKALVWSAELKRYLMGDETPEDIAAMRKEAELRNGPPPPPPAVRRQDPPRVAGGYGGLNRYVMPTEIFGGNPNAGPAASAPPTPPMPPMADNDSRGDEGNNQE
eukprot:TRINITY_DN23874_c3_g1_i2.p1 TRINITY_DN23874_c3_g1~~TRINITY_DN23874_c3_g1_i2.p1  ORF type:complete len:434 (+),score=138.29 TRINITY_DN23874_c3_g1_i2:91-1392(+)